MARKPLIEPGSMIHGSLQDRVIGRDRERAGRPTPPSLANAERDDVKTSSQQDRQQDSLTSSQQDDKTARQPSDNLDSLTARKQAIKLESKQASQTSGSPDITPPEIDPLDRVLLDKLARLYPDLNREGATLISSRLPNEIVSRLGYAADLVKKHRKNKQDVITRGLILAFEELVQSEGEAEWYK